LFNIIDQDNKFLLITSIKPISEIEFNLKDLRSRTKNCLLAKIEKPDDELMFALILKNLSDRQITLDKTLNEKLLYTLLNIIDQDNKFLIITSIKPISEIEFDLEDLRSRTKNCLLAKIEKPDDELMFALILKNLSDRQIILDKKLIDFIIKRVERSYGKIFEFIYKIDMISLKKKKSIDFKIINEALDNKSE